MKDSPYLQKLLEKTDKQLEEMINKEHQFDPNAIRTAKFILENRGFLPDYSEYRSENLHQIRDKTDRDINPIRFDAINDEIKKREYYSDESDEELINKFIDQLDIKPRLGVRFYDINIDDSSDIKLTEFLKHLIKPEFQEWLKIEDDSIELLIKIHVNDYGYKTSLIYQDKYTKKSFVALLDNVSEDLMYEFYKSFIEYGRSSINKLDWEEYDRIKAVIRSLPKVLNILVFIIAGFLIQIDEQKVIEPLGINGKEFANYIVYFLFALYGTLFLTQEIKIFQFHTLSEKEKIEAGISIFLIIGLIFFLIYNT